MVGFQVGKDRSTCYYKLDLDSLKGNDVQDEAVIDMQLGSLLRRALLKSDFVSIRK